MSAATEPAAPPAAVAGWIRPVLVLVATFELLKWASTIGVLLNENLTIPGRTLRGLLFMACAALAIWFAVRGQVARAIYALAAVALLHAIILAPPVLAHWAHTVLSDPFRLVQVIAFPLLAMTAIAHARRNERLGLATLFVALPALFVILGIALFVTGFALYGF